jgi:hypothetical protein
LRYGIRLHTFQRSLFYRIPIMKTLRSKRALARLLPLAGATAILATTACLDSTDPAPPSASVVFINSSGASGDSLVDLYVNNALATPAPQAFFSGGLLYIRDVSSAVNLTVRRSTGDDAASGTFPMAIDSVYMVVYHPNLAGGNGDILFLHDTAQSATTAIFQIANLATRYDAGAYSATRPVDIYMMPSGTLAPGATPSPDDRIATDLPFGAVRPYRGILQDVGQDTGYVMVVVTRKSDGVEIARSDSISASPGHVVTLMIGDQVGSVAPRLYSVETASPF